ncbi:MAG: 2Fe-2S iron-sulfur cluster binding domain-containing protein [Pseudomonadota bacterium]|nr:2Fe-2S iron-sulfur cluster binding domain-containing protein [Pseudomonadota bacterium]
MKHAVRIAGIDRTFWCDENDSLLTGILKANSSGIPAGCRGGGCGVCKIQILSGEFSTGCMSGCHVSAEDKAAGKLLACRVYPRSDIELSVIGKMIRCFQKVA